MSIEQGKDISELFRRVSNIIRIGKVISVDYTKAKAKVKIGNLTTDFMPWLTPSTSAWIPLKNGEQVLVLSPNGDLRMGMILPALYQNTKSPPAHDSNKITFNV
ncbi:MAG: phage baseplate assembly protein V, partial [Alphaproteobacteria bacterium]|nr:phage baseplate assembly protein V [Alphaproteobacteria bacterium]